MFLGLPDPLVTRTDPAPDPDQAPDPVPDHFHHQAKIERKMLIYSVLNFFKLFNSVPDPDPYVFGHPGSASGLLSESN
jgi:hypothetical protein